MGCLCESSAIATTNARRAILSIFGSSCRTVDQGIALDKLQGTEIQCPSHTFHSLLIAMAFEMRPLKG